MAKYIQLYLDTDFILPIGVGESGAPQKYIDEQASRRLWLYFNKTANNMYESSEIIKNNFEAERDGYYGNFWEHIGNKDKIVGTPYDYIDLLDLSGIITKLREWCSLTLFTDNPEVVLNFSTVIPLKARRAFVDYIEKKLGKVRSYSIEMNDLLSSKIVYDYSSLSPSFGDQILIIQSSGRDILLSVQTWCGDMFMQGENDVRLEKKGNDYLKYALAKIVVDHYEQTYNMLLPEAKEREYLYQKQFADEWLKGRNEDDTFWIDHFYYSANPSNIYPSFQVDGRQLDLIEREAIRAIIDNISKYYRENLENGHLHTILLGDVFKEEIFLRSCVSCTSSENKYTYFNDNAIQEALGRYYLKYSTLTEELKNLERIFMDKSNERARIRKYVENARELGTLRTALDAAVVEMNKAIEEVKQRNEGLVSSWEAAMKRSDFDQADKLVKQMSVSNNLLDAIKSSTDTIKRKERNNSLLIELKQLKDVVNVIDDTIRTYERLKELIDEAERLNNLREELGKTTQKYRDFYSKYKELKRQFELEKVLAIRRKILEEMKELTMEELPVLDVAPIRGRIEVKVSRKGGILGFCVKKKLTFTLTIDKPLPCRGVLVISPVVKTSLPPGRVGVCCFDVDKGAQGEVINFTKLSTELQLGKSPETVFVKFWPHEEEIIPINCFEISGGGVIRI